MSQDIERVTINEPCPCCEGPLALEFARRDLSDRGFQCPHCDHLLVTVGGGRLFVKFLSLVALGGSSLLIGGLFVSIFLCFGALFGGAAPGSQNEVFYTILSYVFYALTTLSSVALLVMLARLLSGQLHMLSSRKLYAAFLVRGQPKPYILHPFRRPVARLTATSKASGGAVSLLDDSASDPAGHLSLSDEQGAVSIIPPRDEA